MKGGQLGQDIGSTSPIKHLAAKTITSGFYQPPMRGSSPNDYMQHLHGPAGNEQSSTNHGIYQG
jgi:hypothetical protein